MKKFEKNFLLLCDHALVDQHNKVSLIGIFDELHLLNFPGALLKMVLVGNFDIIDSGIQEVEIRVELINDKEKAIVLNIPPVKMKVMRQGDRNAKLNFILDIGNLNFPEPGKYTFNIKK